MNGASIILLVVAFGLVDLMIIGAVLHSAGTIWKRIASEWPSQPISEPNYGRRWQSLAVGVFNFGLMWHMISDVQHVHLIPHGPLSKVIRLTRVSIPRAAINEFAATHAPKPDGTYPFVEVRVGHCKVRLPGWVAGHVR